MWDNLTPLQPATVKEIQTVLFLRKLHQRSDQRAGVPGAGVLIQQCNKIWEDQSDEEATAGAMAAAVAATPRPHSPFRGTHRSSSPFHWKGSAGDTSAAAHQPPASPGRRQ